MVQSLIWAGSLWTLRYLAKESVIGLNATSGLGPRTLQHPRSWHRILPLQQLHVGVLVEGVARGGVRRLATSQTDILTAKLLLLERSLIRLLGLWIRSVLGGC